jgi:hypothetical protein
MSEIEDQVLETARQMLWMCIQDEPRPGFEALGGLPNLNTRYGCTDGWLWAADAGIGAVGMRTELPNAGSQKLGVQIVSYFADEPTVVYELPIYLVARLGGLATTQLGTADFTILSGYATGLVYGATPEPDPATMIEIWTTVRDGVTVFRLRHENREAMLAGCEPTGWHPVYDLPLVEVEQ